MVFAFPVDNLGGVLAGLLLLTVEQGEGHTALDALQLLGGLAQHLGGILVEATLRVMRNLRLDTAYKPYKAYKAYK